MFAEGSLPEHDTLVLEIRSFFMRCLPKAACRSVTPWLKKDKTNMYFLVRCLPKAACPSVSPWLLKRVNFL